MSTQNIQQHERLTMWVRCLLVLAGVGAIGLLLLAASLTPNSRGIGTHRQLGLGPCTIQALLGIRCPACGMTTSWTHLTHGNLLGGLRANVAGVLLGVTAALFGVWSVSSGARGRWLVALKDWQVLIIVSILLAITLIEWLIRLGIAGS